MLESYEARPPDRLPLFWRLTFRLFMVGGVLSLLTLTGSTAPGAVVGGLSAAVLFGAGYFGLNRRATGLYLSLLVLAGAAAKLALPWLVNDDYVAGELHRFYASIGKVLGTPMTPDAQLISQVEMLYAGATIAITLIHAWMCLYLWRHRHWFAEDTTLAATKDGD